MAYIRPLRMITSLMMILALISTTCVVIAQSQTSASSAAGGSASAYTAPPSATPIPSSGSQKKQPPATCTMDLKNPNASVYGPLEVNINKEFVDFAKTLLVDSFIGKILVTPSASICIANMDGKILRDTLQKGLQAPKCDKTSMTAKSMPFLKRGVDAWSDMDALIKWLTGSQREETDAFCNFYVDELVPCLSTILLPSLAVVRARHSNGCCDNWVDETLDWFGYSISNFITTVLQKVGDAICSVQKPGTDDAKEQRCGYTIAQTLFPKESAAENAVNVLNFVKTPTDQACLQAEGKAYFDTKQEKIAATKGTFMSGCVEGINQLAEWIYNLPYVQNSKSLKLFFEKNECVQGNAIYNLLAELFPADLQEVAKSLLDNTCGHLPYGYSSKCEFSRPIDKYIDWPNRPIASWEKKGVSSNDRNSPSPVSGSPVASQESTAMSNTVSLTSMLAYAMMMTVILLL